MRLRPCLGFMLVAKAKNPFEVLTGSGIDISAVFKGSPLEVSIVLEPDSKSAAEWCQKGNLVFHNKGDQIWMPVENGQIVAMLHESQVKAWISTADFKGEVDALSARDVIRSMQEEESERMTRALRPQLAVG